VEDGDGSREMVVVGAGISLNKNPRQQD